LLGTSEFREDRPDYSREPLRSSEGTSILGTKWRDGRADEPQLNESEAERNRPMPN